MTWIIKDGWVLGVIGNTIWYRLPITLKQPMTIAEAFKKSKHDSD